MEITPARQWALNQILYEDVLREIEEHFQHLQVPYMPIKGAHLICTGLAEKMKERFISDIDILVKEKDIQKVSDYFAALNNCNLKTYFTENYRPTESVFFYTINNVQVCLEIQCQLNVPERFLLPGSELFARSTNVDKVKRLPSAEDALLIFLCHLQTHIPFEFRDTTWEEINLLASQEGFDWDVFWQRCPSTGIEAFIYFILKVCRKMFPVPLKPSRHYWFAARMADIFSESQYQRMSPGLRRLFLDIPFVRKPLGLLFYKVFHTKKEKTL